MTSKTSNRLDKWRAKYGAIVIAFTCLVTSIMTWGNNWILTGVLGVGVLVCGIIGVYDLKQATNEK